MHWCERRARCVLTQTVDDQASLLGFAVFKVLPQSKIFSNRPLTVHENM